MTNEVIISSLRGLIGKYNLTDEEWQTVEKTIEVLSNSDGDCISRKEAINAFQQFREYDSNRNNNEWVDRIETVLKAQLSVQPKLKYVAVGNVNFDKDELQKIIDETIPTIMPEIEYRKAHWQNNACSNCGIYNASAYKNWCPNCGCQMTEDTE